MKNELYSNLIRNISGKFYKIFFDEYLLYYVNCYGYTTLNMHLCVKANK